MDPLGWVLLALTTPVALGTWGLARAAGRGGNPLQRWLATAWWLAIGPLFLVEAATGLDGEAARRLAEAATAWQALLAVGIHAYLRRLGLRARARQLARGHVLGMGCQALLYAPLIAYPTGETAAFMILSGLWLLPALYAYEQGKALWAALGSWREPA